MTGKVITHPSFPPAAAGLIAARLLNRHSAYEIGQAIDILLDVLDLMDGDHEDKPDFTARPDGLTGDPADAEPDDDAKGDQSWPEDIRARKAMHGSYGAFNEDAEDDDEAEEDDPSGQCDEDEVSTSLASVRYTVGASGAGCPISDPGGGNVLDGPHDPEEYLLPAYGTDQSLGPVNGVTAYQLHDLSRQLADLRQHGEHTLAKGVAAKITRIAEREVATIARANAGNDN